MMKILLLGDDLESTVGQRPLLNDINYALVHGSLTGKDYIPIVIDYSFKTVSIDGKTHDFWIDSISGRQQYERLLQLALNNIDGAIICFRHDVPSSIESIERWAYMIQFYNPNATITLLGITAKDATETDNLSSGDFNFIKRMSKEYNARFISSTIDDDQSINDAFMTTARSIFKEPTPPKVKLTTKQRILQFFKPHHQDIPLSPKPLFFRDFIKANAKHFSDAVMTISQGAKEQQESSSFRNFPNDLLMHIFNNLNKNVAKDSQMALVWSAFLMKKIKNNQLLNGQERSIEYGGETFDI
jgi:GTPase SAR1 family protein